MLYQLPNGKVIDIDLDDILNMDQESIQLLLSYDIGMYVNSPFYLSNIELLDQLENSEYDPEEFFRTYFPEEYGDDDDPIELNTDII
jgi:hypothetical protein